MYVLTHLHVWKHKQASAKVNQKHTRYTQRVQTSAEHRITQLVSNPEDLDFGLWTPGSEA